MQLDKLTLNDIGTFGGKQVFDLVPRVRYGSKRPIILVGGLNGAGKTTFLTAIRLALYGRQSMESGSTQKDYEHFLQQLIHRAPHSVIRATAASISLEFTYARLGERVRYKVLRTWEERSQGVEEHLRVFRNGEDQEALSGDQAQAFLNQLIPSGISQFFFFDGEKISALARDDSDTVLTYAIRRLLGLDLADRLGSDLSVYLRQRRLSAVDEKTQTTISELGTQLASLEEEIQGGLRQLEVELAPALREARAESERRRTELMERGGAWAIDRDELMQHQERLRSERRELEEKLREHLSGPAVFALAPKLSEGVVSALEQGQGRAEQRALAKAIYQQAEILKARLGAIRKLQAMRPIVETCIDKWAKTVTPLQVGANAEIELKFSDIEARNAIVSLGVVVPSAQRELRSTYDSAHRIALEEDLIQERLSHAPSEGSLRDAFDALTKAAETVAMHESVRKQRIEEMRRKTWLSIELTRKLKKLESSVNNESADVRGENIAESLQALIEEFKAASAREKCKTLQDYFISAFKRLSRKGDIVHDARIDAGSFGVTLLDRAGQEIQKKRLSAGEKQIYAIAMLEALAKTSGRNLPIIIDTPLGRLDSKHRRKLVESYFPVASHQVIVLSTDTEVDAAFYKGLQPHLSHGYHLWFDELEGSTKSEEGYFWKNLGQEAQEHAA